MKRYVKASTDNVSKIISELQNSSNNLVDLILELMDKLPEVEQYIKDYDAVSGESESIESEFVSDVYNVCGDIKYACDGLVGILHSYKPRKD